MLTANTNYFDLIIGNSPNERLYILGANIEGY
jgi:hypothetical protein